MFKKKQKSQAKNPSLLSPMKRLDTECDTLPQKQGKTRAELAQRFQCQSQTQTTKRLKLKCKQLQKLFLNVKLLLEQELDHLLIGEENIWDVYCHLMQSELFRVGRKTKDQVLEDVNQVIQALELLYSKLHNNQKVKDVLFVKDQGELLLFFKHLFGKPYTVCNRPNFRKVLNTIWQHQIFESFDPKKMVDHLRQWCAGIHYPLNPASIPIHRLIFTNPSLIKKYSLLQSNELTYSHIDSADCMGLTPLLTAIHSNNTAAYEQILKAGADIYRCPLVLIKNERVVTVSKRGTKETVQITQPVVDRRQFNGLEVLLYHRQFQQIVNILSLSQVYKLKKMKKNNAEIAKKLKQIPDCCLQIHWKTYKGFLSFKQLPKDIITIYKKQGSLRLDYHIDDLQQTNSQPKHYSILIRTSTEQTQLPKLQYYYIDHFKKKIYNFMKEIHAEKLKLRYEQVTQLGNVEQQYITYLKAVGKVSQGVEHLDVTAQFFYENVLKAPIYDFKDVNTYERTLFQSDIIDYAILQESQTKCSLKQVIGQLPKVKSKQTKSSSNFKIEWSKQKITLAHITYILQLLDKKSPLFLKLTPLFNLLLTDQQFSQKYSNKLPIKMTVDLGSDFSLQAEIKNLTYLTLDDAVFGLEYRTKKMQYQEENLGVESLQETMIMEENYSISMSRFLGNTERMLDIEEDEANRKFQELLSREIAGDLSDEQTDSYQKKQSKINSQRIIRQDE